MPSCECRRGPAEQSAEPIGCFGEQSSATANKFLLIAAAIFAATPGAAIQRIVRLIDHGRAGREWHAARFCGEAIMDSRIKSAIAKFAHARPARVGSVGIAVLIAIALGTVRLPAQQARQPQVSDMSL